MFFTTSTFLDPPADIHIQSKSSHKFQLTNLFGEIRPYPPPRPVGSRGINWAALASCLRRSRGARKEAPATS